jgi:hypothetical protein
LRLRSEKCLTGEEIETGEEKPKKKKPEGGGAAAGIGFAAPFVVLSFFDVFSLPPFLLFFLFYPLVFLVFLSGFSFRSLLFVSWIFFAPFSSLFLCFIESDRW